jgi:hypothetical protein
LEILEEQVSDSLNLAEIVRDIDAGRPICVKVNWAGGGAHTLAIDGYHSALNMIAVDDPWYGASDVVLSVFQTAYQGSGTWTYTYRVSGD